MVSTCVVTHKYGQYMCGDIPSNSDTACPTSSDNSWEEEEVTTEVDTARQMRGYPHVATPTNSLTSYKVWETWLYLHIETMEYDHIEETMGYDHIEETMGYDHIEETMGYDHIEVTMGYDHIKVTMGYEHIEETMGMTIQRRPWDMTI